MKNLIIIIGLFSFVYLAGCQKSSSNQAANDLPEKLVDRIELTDLDGKAIMLDDLKGKTIFLNFWATWCRPCLAEMPDIDKAAKILGEENFVFLAASDEDIIKIQKFAFKNKHSFQYVHSKTSVFDLDIIALPTTMIIDSNGEIIYNEVGARDWASKKELDNLRNLALK